MVMKHWRTPSAACDLTRVSLSWWQFVAGTSIPILEDNRCLPQIWKESKYIESLRQYLISIGGTIEVHKDYPPFATRKGCLSNGSSVGLKKIWCHSNCLHQLVLLVLTDLDCV